MSLNKLIASGSIAAILLIILGVFYTMGGVINTSPSIPPGFYLKADKPLTIGRFVMFCPPKKPEFQDALNKGYISSGSCPDNFGSMMLKVAGMPGDKITINENGVFVNNVLQAESKPKQQDAEGRAMAVLVLDNYELKEGEILLLSDANSDAFDGRYFGPVHFDQIDSVISPLF